jgi:hypothetical protein
VSRSSAPTGLGVFHGLDPETREYCEGWTQGHDDGEQRHAVDSVLAEGKDARATGYRDGYKIAQLRFEEPDALTLIGLGAP